MTTLDAVFLGILQGLTEFLPVSSSGHLVVAETWMNLSLPARELLTVNVLLHAGTALAILLCYWRTWWRILCFQDTKHRRLLLMLIVATIPGAIAGLQFESFVTEHLHSITTVGAAFIFTGGVLLVAPKLRGSDTKDSLTIRQAILIGLAQALAIIPGISRSGLTTAVGKMSGLSREEALDFSFLMALPIILGATLVTALNIVVDSVALPESSVWISGFATSFVCSVLAIYSLKIFVRKHTLAWFAAYLIPLGLTLLT